MPHEQLTSNVEHFVALLAGAMMLAIVSARVPLPYTVVLLIAGLVAALIGAPAPFAFGESLLVVFLPSLLFEGAWHLDVRKLARERWTLLYLAFGGVAITAAFVTAAVTATGALAFAPALVIGAIVSATDPVAVVALFRELKVPDRLSVIVETESLSNDGLASVLYASAVALASPSISAPTWLSVTLSFVELALGGLAVGVVLALLLAQLLRVVDDTAERVVATVLLAYGAYFIAELVHVSGIFATVAAGVTLRARLSRHPERVNGEADKVDEFWEVVAFLANSFVFIVMGLSVHPSRITHEPVLVIAAIVAVFVSRFVLVYGGVVFPFVRTTLPLAWRHVVALSGLRGGLSLALALTLPDDVPHRAQIIDAVFAVVIVTLISQGTGLAPVLKRLKL